MVPRQKVNRHRVDIKDGLMKGTPVSIDETFISLCGSMTKGLRQKVNRHRVEMEAGLMKGTPPM